MLGLLRNVIENFDLRRFPHEYPEEHRTRYTEDDLKNKNMLLKNIGLVLSMDI